MEVVTATSQTAGPHPNTTAIVPTPPVDVFAPTDQFERFEQL